MPILSKGLTGELLWNWGRRSLAATAKACRASIKSLLPCISHQGDCKHWLPAIVFYKTSLSCQNTRIHVLTQTAIRPQVTFWIPKIIFVIVKEVEGEKLSSQWRNLKIQICLYLFHGNSYVATFFSQNFLDFGKYIECCHLIGSIKVLLSGTY